MWKYLVLILLTHYILVATGKDLSSPPYDFCAESENTCENRNDGYLNGGDCITIDEQKRNEYESDSYFYVCEPSKSCPDDDDDDRDESNEDCNDNDDDNNCKDDNSPPDSNICNCNNGRYGGCSALPLRSTACSGAVDRALGSIFDLSVKLGFSVLPELDPNRAYYLSSVVPPWFTIAAMTQFTYGETLKELLNILNMRNREEVVCAVESIHECMSTICETETLRIVTNYSYIFENDRYRLTYNFKNILERIFRVSARNINFKDYVEALSDMNNFVRMKTEGEDVSVSQVFFNKGPIRLLQLAPFYFKASRREACNLPSYQDNFYSDQDCIVPDITYFRNLQCVKIGYSEYFNAELTEIDLEDGFKYIGIQPNRNVDINEVVRKLNYDSFICERAKLQCKLTDISFPNLTPTQTKFNSRKAIQRTVGNIRLYDYNRAQIKGVSYGDPQLSITHGLQSIYWLPAVEGNRCPAKNPKPEAVSKSNNNMLILIMRGNMVYMVQRVQNIPRDTYQYIAQDIIGF